MSSTLSAPLTWTDVARRLAAVAATREIKGVGQVRRARLGRYGILLEVGEGVGESEVQVWLENIFPGRVQDAPLRLTLEGPDHAATVPVELEVGGEQSVFRPSFGLVDGTVEFDPPAAVPRVGRKLPIAAALSVKGGTGRTTTAVALALRWAALAKMPVLLVDADLEAPGISYLFREQVAEAKISLEDVITLAHAEEEEGATATVEFAASKLLDHLIPGNLFVLPLRRDVDELVGSAIKPEHLSTPSNPFAFADILASLAQRRGCAGVVVDVRAGLVPLAVNLAMDPEVSPVIVTTLADQSLKATASLVRFLSQEIRRTGGHSRKPLLVVNRVPNVLRHAGLDQKLLEPLTDQLLASLVPEVRDDVPAGESVFDRFPPIEPFAQVHVPELPELQVSAATWTGFREQIGSSGFAQFVGPTLDRWVETELLSGVSADTETRDPAPDTTETRRRSLANYADDLIAAENSSSPVQRPLVTKPLAALAERFLSEVPIAVSEGAKGTGKTLAARFFVAQKRWDRVVEQFLDRSGAVPALILPVCASIQSSAKFQAEADKARVEVAGTLGYGAPMLINATTESLKERMSSGSTEQAWTDFWLDIIAWSAGFEVGLPSVGGRFADTLRASGQNVVVVVEGLEELYDSVGPNIGTSMRALLVGVVQRLRAEPKRPLGLVAFARRDTIEASVTQNLDQFRREYSKFALTWADDDILELAAWLASQAEALPGIWTPQFTEYTPSQKAVQLEQLWGRKLGPDDRPGKRSREAYTATWITAVLSDLRGRLVPRDLIRLLAKAARVSLEAGEGSEYQGRLLIPRALRAAVEPTSERKVAETEEEIPELRAIFDKFRVKKDQVAAPIDQDALDSLGIEPHEIDVLRRHGIVYGDAPPYEVPELFRRGLGLRHTGARRNVVNLYRRARQS